MDCKKHSTFIGSFIKFNTAPMYRVMRLAPAQSVGSECQDYWSPLGLIINAQWSSSLLVYSSSIFLERWTVAAARARPVRH